MSRPTCSPGLTRFDIPLRPKDGSKHYVLSVDTERGSPTLPPPRAASRGPSVETSPRPPSAPQDLHEASSLPPDDDQRNGHFSTGC